MVCTIGPASDSEQIVEKLIRAGMNIARLNFSHGTYTQHARSIEKIRKISARLNLPVAILQDLPGPKVRTGDLKQEEILLEEGSMLKKGDVIMRLSNTNLILDISNNEAQVARAINELRTARLMMVQQLMNSESQIIETGRLMKLQERAYNNNKILYEQEHISSEEYEQSEEQYEATKKKLELLMEIQYQDSVFRAIQVESLENSVSSMTRNLEIIKGRLESLNVKAPVNGELASLIPEIGQVISYGTRIGTVNVLDSYKLRVEIDEHYIARVQRELRGDCDFAGAAYPGQITKIYPEVTNGRFYVDMEFDDEIPSTIRIGQTSRIKLELGESKEAVLIPRGGFYQSTGGQWVFIVDERGEIASRRSISIGRQNPRFYEVLSGLEPGEQVIISSYDNFGDVDILILKD